MPSTLSDGILALEFMVQTVSRLVDESTSIDTVSESQRLAALAQKINEILSVLQDRPELPPIVELSLGMKVLPEASAEAASNWSPSQRTPHHHSTPKILSRSVTPATALSASTNDVKRRSFSFNNTAAAKIVPMNGPITEAVAAETVAADIAQNIMHPQKNTLNKQIQNIMEESTSSATRRKSTRITDKWEKVEHSMHAKKHNWSEGRTTEIELTKIEMAKAEEAFSLLDVNNDGHLSVHEIFSVLSCMGVVPTVHELHALMQEFDLDGDGTIKLNEFVLMMVNIKIRKGAEGGGGSATGVITQTVEQNLTSITDLVKEVSRLQVNKVIHLYTFSNVCLPLSALGSYSPGA
jgi:Ca2+-binding EF-hand superfamily protein